MNRFSTCRRLMPAAVSVTIAAVTARMAGPCPSTTRANKPVMGVSVPVWRCGLPVGQTSIMQGTTRKLRNRPRVIPVVIIQPKSMTGWMPDTTSDTKATMVVMPV